MTGEEILALELLGTLGVREQVADWLEELDPIRADPYRYVPAIDVADRYVFDLWSIRQVLREMSYGALCRSDASLSPP